MKKVSLFLLLILCSVLSFGKFVSVEQAKLAGFNFLQHRLGTDKLGGIDQLTLSYTSLSKSGSNCFYVFNAPVGFVMVSAEDGVVPVLAYSTDRHFVGTKISKNVLSFLEGYNNQIDYVAVNQLPATTEIADQWNRLANNLPERSAERTTAVSPLLVTTWDQDPYYNDLCPWDAGSSSRCVTGCVATATAQVMKFWNWPATGTGSHSYSSSYGTLTANFGATTYNWTSMPNNVTAANTAVATLMYHVGVGVEMGYGPASSGGSSAYVINYGSSSSACAQNALINYFKYDPAMQGLARSSYSDAAWLALIEGELNASRPVIYDGHGSAGGHCFVVDGYDVSNNFHVNWGWSGSGPDGYYYMDALNPPALGTGGGAGGFNTGQEAIIGVRPIVGPITGTLTVCVGQHTTLSEVASGGSWTSSAPSIATVSSSGVVTGVSAGNSTITFSLGGNSVTAVVTVNPLPNAGTISGGSVSICMGQHQYLNDVATGGTWSSTPTTVATVNSSGVVTGVSTGTATISYTSTNSCGTVYATAVVSVNTSSAITTPPSVPTAGSPCAGSVYTFNATCAGASTFNWLVTGTGWSGSSSTSTLVEGVGTGTGRIIVSGSNICGAGPNDTFFVTPTLLPTNPSMALTSSIPCSGTVSTETFSASSTGATTYNWNVLGSGWSYTGTGSNITVTVGTGAGTLICQTSNICGSSASDTLMMSSSPLPSRPMLTLSGSACVGSSSATYTAASSGATSYHWTVLGAGWSGSSTTNVLNFTIGTAPTGTIICNGIDSCGAGVSDTTFLTPGLPVTSNFSVANHVTIPAASDLLTYTGTGTSTATYSWNFGGGTASPGVGIGPHHVTWATTGHKTLTLSVIDNGCSSVIFTDTVLVVSSSLYQEELTENNRVIIYPNANAGIFNVVFDMASNTPVNIQLTDMQGKVVYKENFDSSNSKLLINSGNLPAGMYFATIITDYATFNKKVIISK